MQPFHKLFYLLALLKVDGIGDSMAKKLLTHFRSPEAVFAAKSNQLAGIDGIGTVLLRKLKDKTVFEKANKELKFIKSTAIKVSFFQDENYPDRLKHCIDAPVLIFTSGRID